MSCDTCSSTQVVTSTALIGQPQSSTQTLTTPHEKQSSVTGKRTRAGASSPGGNNSRSRRVSQTERHQ